MCVSLASRTRSATKFNPVAYVSVSDVGMVPVDLGAQAEATRERKNIATANICTFATAKLANNSWGGAAKATGALRTVALVVWSSFAERVLQMRRRKAVATKNTGWIAA